MSIVESEFQHPEPERQHLRIKIGENFFDASSSAGMSTEEEIQNDDDIELVTKNRKRDGISSEQFVRKISRDTRDKVISCQSQGTSSTNSQLRKLAFFFLIGLISTLLIWYIFF